ncbi:hypothetical protein BDP27DRAFT_1205419, partial [Rhodocollybia butyracea]
EGNSIWLLSDCQELCDHLVPHVAAAADTKKFKASVMNSAVELLNKQLRAGGKKKAAGVKQKISDVRVVSIA